MAFSNFCGLRKRPGRSILVITKLSNRDHSIIPFVSFVARNLKIKVRWNMRSAECGVRSAECGVRSAECGVRSAECGVRSAECGVRSAECGV